MYRYGKEELDLATRVIKSGSWFRYYGSEEHLNTVAGLEKKLAEYTGVEHVLATSSGTGALISALAALGIGPQDEVLVPAYTFVATAAAAIAVGAVPVIVEIDETLTMDAHDIKRNITPRTRVIAPVHMLGYPSNMDDIMAIAQEHDLKVLEDSAQAVGGHYKGRPLGAIGDIGAFSLQWHKIITSGEGGAVLTRSPELYERAAIYHDDAHCFRGIDQGIPAFPGVNYRMSEIAGAIACAQADRLPGIITDLRAVKQKLSLALGDIAPFRIAPSHDSSGDAGWILTIQTPDRETANKYSELTGTGSVLDTRQTNWHIYYHWDYILEKRSVSGSGFPWKVGDWESPVQYSKEMCPNTLDILQRSFNYHLQPDWTDQQIEETAKKIRTGIEQSKPAMV